MEDIYIDPASVTGDTKIILSIVKPTLKNIETVNSVLTEALEEIKVKNRDIVIIKRILIGDEDSVIADGKPGGMKKDIMLIRDLLNSPEMDMSVIIRKLDSDEEVHREILRILKERIPWTAKMTGFKDIAMTIGIIVTAVISIISLAIR